jgi:hypothetical protein
MSVSPQHGDDAAYVNPTDAEARAAGDRVYTGRPA